MSIRDASEALLVLPCVESVAELTNTGNSEWCDTAWYLSEDGERHCKVGSVLLVPTYRLEEVEEVVEPEKPGVPVEPYVGMVWQIDGHDRVVLEVCEHSGWFQWAGRTRVGNWDIATHPYAPRSLLKNVVGYPHTPSTPAVTRKVKKWVKIEPSPDSPEC